MCTTSVFPRPSLVFEKLDATGQGFYVPGELMGERPLTYVLPPGSYEAWMVISP